MSDGPYARLYLSLIDDEKFETIYDNDHHFAAWCRLLMIAEAAWPASGHLPRSTRRASIRALTDAGLIDILPGGRYRIHGLDAERQRRSMRAQSAANVRWDAERNAASIPASSAEDMPSKAEHSKAEQSRAPREADDPADAYWSLTGRYPTHRTLAWIDDLIGQFGSEATTRALVGAFRADQAVPTLLGRTSDALRAEARSLDRREREEERERLRQKRAVPRPATGPDAEFRAMLEARYAERGGGTYYGPTEGAA